MINHARPHGHRLHENAYCRIRPGDGCCDVAIYYDDVVHDADNLAVSRDECSPSTLVIMSSVGVDNVWFDVNKARLQCGNGQTYHSAVCVDLAVDDYVATFAKLNGI